MRTAPIIRNSTIALLCVAMAFPALAATTTPQQAGLIDPATGYTYAGAPVAHHTVAKKRATHTRKKTAVKKARKHAVKTKAKTAAAH